MLKIVKSKSILKKIFLNTCDKIKFNLVVHYKDLQNKLGLKIIDFRRYSERYIIMEKDGKGKEYNSFNDILLFEGEYKNGKRNGKGKEYNKRGNIIYEGEYLNNNKRKGKEIDYNNEIIYEGEYLYGLKNGKGKLYYWNNSKIIEFEGEYLNGKRNGQGKEYNIKGQKIYEGEYLYNQRYKGKEYHQGNIIYEGEYLFNKKWNGKLYDKNGKTSYDIKNGNGYIKEYNENNQLIYEGESKNGEKWNGKEIYYEKDCFQFEIEYINGKINPRFVVKEYNNEFKCLIFKGDFYDEKYKNKDGYNFLSFKKENFTGNGEEFFENGNLKYKGEYLNGKKWNGKLFYDINEKIKGEIRDGNEYDNNGNIINGEGYIQKSDLLEGPSMFSGEFKNGLKNGIGREYSCCNEGGPILLFEGEYSSGQKNGKGKEFDYYGNLIFKGKYSWGERHGQGKEYDNNGKLIFKGKYMYGKRWFGKFYGDEGDNKKGNIIVGCYLRGKYYEYEEEEEDEEENEEENEEEEEEGEGE